ncbi:MAG TPA: NAD-dependent epimerase/dehydratase family protein [Tepidisphaeraceae bacterium]|nr:NAD-dependent epimerase/dehydratase family protein [Tepidisphaeraceae bacterium]
MTIQTADDILLDDLNTLCSKTLSSELKKLAGKSVLVTGGAGFLGYYLVQTITHYNTLAAANDRIRLTVFDNLSRGVPGWLTCLTENRALTLVRHDMKLPLPKPLGHFHWIIHAASIASPTYYRIDPIGTMDANINGLRNLLDYALQRKESGAPVEGILFFSSSEIYGDPDAANIPTREDYRGLVSCTGPRACYDEAKRFGETLCVNFAKQHGVAVKTARPFNNYGPGLKITDGRLIPDFARDILSGRDIVMLSDGTPTRTFCYSADAIQGYMKILVKGAPGEAYNIGTETPEISVAELAEKMIALSRELFGYRGKLERKQSRDKEYLIDNPNRRCPVIEKARSHLGYEPLISLDEGLRRSLIWYSGNRDAEEK